MHEIGCGPPVAGSRPWLHHYWLDALVILKKLDGSLVFANRLIFNCMQTQDFLRSLMLGMQVHVVRDLLRDHDMLVMRVRKLMLYIHGSLPIMVIPVFILGHSLLRHHNHLSVQILIRPHIV